MASNSKIEWTDATWNPVRGCTRVSEGCRNCYAERMAARGLPGLNSPKTGDSFAIMTASGPHWTGKVELIESALKIPLRWRKSRRIFVNSMSDLFHESLSDDAIDRVFAVMALCPQHAFQVLTKRAERMRGWTDRLQKMADDWKPHTKRGEFTPSDVLNFKHMHRTFGRGPAFPYKPWPLSNIWLGVSVEDQKNLDRIKHLRNTPAAVRFLSLEPLLEDLGDLNLDGIHWVICGGESGPGARPMHPGWVRSVRDQCAAASVPFFFKQWGGVHKKAAGRLLDGREHMEFPNG